MKTRLRLGLAGLAAWGVAAAAPAASAQTAPPTPASSPENRALAETLFFTARGLMEAGRYPEACGKLAESYRLDPAAGTLLNLAVCHQKEGKIASAWGEFRQALGDARKAGRADREKLATEAIAQIEPDLPFLTITVPDRVRVQGLVISRNGVPLNAAAWSTALPADPGEVVVQERAPGYKPRELKITLERRVRASLVAEPLDPAPVVLPPASYWTAKRTVGAALFGAGVLAAGAGTYFGVLAINDKKASDGACPTDAAGQLRCSPGGVSSMNDASTAAWVADVSLGVAGVAAIVGAYLFLTGGGVASESSSSAASGGSWRVGMTPGGGVVSGTF